MSEFIPGLTLARGFFFEFVEPLLAKKTPGVAYSAALIGPGSDVLGFDTPVSCDHDWGPRLQIFLPASESPERATLIDRVLASELPREYRGHPVAFAAPDERGWRRPLADAAPPLAHLIEISSAGPYARKLIGFDPLEEIDVHDWLSALDERLLELTAGEVFTDPVGELTRMRERLSYYPREVWIFRMAAQWRRIAEREALVARAGVGGDDLGSRLALAGLAREIVRLAFLLERRYAPRDLWLARALMSLRSASRLSPLLSRALSAYDWMQRELRLMDCYAVLVALHNNLGLTDTVEIPGERNSRGFLTMDAGRVATSLEAKVGDQELKAALRCRSERSADVR